MAELNDIIANWGRQSKNRFLYNIQRLPFRKRLVFKKEIKHLRDGTSLRLVRSNGDIVRVAWRFTRHGIFQEHGVGRNRRKGSGKEKPMPWLVPTLDAMTPLLADELQDESIKQLGLVIDIKVNGLFDITLK